MRLLFTLSILLFSIAGSCQDLLNESWYITKDGPASQADFAWGLDLDASDNIYWTTSQKVNTENEKDIFTYKISPSGNEVWPSPHGYEAPKEQQAYNLRFKDGIAYVAGRTWTDNGLLYSNALVYAIDTMTKDTLWSWIYDGGIGYEEIDGLWIENDGVYVSGWTQDADNNYDLFVAHLDLNGNQEWLTQFGSNNYDTADGHCIVDDSTVYISGMYNSWGFIFFGDAMLTAFDRTTGEYKWHQLWGGSGQEDGMGLNTDGTYLYQCGVTTSFGDSLVFINKYDKNGSLIWSAHTDMVYKTRSLDIAANGDLYLAATTDTYGAGGDDLMIMRYDSNTGILIDYRTWGGTENESVQDIKIQENFMYLTGRTISFSANTFEDAFLIKAPLFNTNELESNSPESTIHFYPNPVKNSLFIDNLPIVNCKIEVLDIHGKCIHSENSSSQSIILDTSKWKNGVYLLIIESVGVYKFLK